MGWLEDVVTEAAVWAINAFGALGGGVWDSLGGGDGVHDFEGLVELLV